jgi:hypothetical protein
VVAVSLVRRHRGSGQGDRDDDPCRAQQDPLARMHAFLFPVGNKAAFYFPA